MSFKIFLLGQFKLQVDNLLIELPSRPAQSLLAYLALNAGLTHRREKLASLFWPEASDSNARSYLRQALWRLRKSLQSASLAWENYLQISDIEVVFREQSDYWLDVDAFLGGMETQSVEKIVEVIRLYRGELLPGFYEEWVVFERERLQAAYHQKMNVLLERLLQARRWDEVLVWAEQWILLDYAPEPAFRMLMQAHAGLGDQGMVSATYQRCAEAINRDLGLEPSPETQRLYEQLRTRKEPEPFTRLPIRATEPPSFLDKTDVEVERPIFVAREPELAQLDRFLDLALDGQGRVVFVTGETGSGKTALVQEFARRAQETHTGLLFTGGNCNAYTGIGDPYSPFREILGLLTGDVEAHWAAGAMTREHALRLWNTLPLAAQAIVEAGPDLIDTFVPCAALRERASLAALCQADWLTRLDERVGGKPAGPGMPSSQQSDLFEQYTRVLQNLAHRVALVLLVDDLQWADRGSISLLFHLGRRLAGNRILIIGSYRPEEVAIGRDGERHPLDPVVNELQRDFGNITVNIGQAESRDFVEALLDSEPNRLSAAFREMLYRQTHGHPLFTVELLRGLQERGDLKQDQEGCWVEGSTLDWETLPARVEAVIAERIGRLPPTLLALLQVASVEGELFTAEVIARVRAADEQEVLGRLSGELDRKHRLISAQSILRLDGKLLSRYRFRHILFQKYLYSNLDEVEQVHLHERVGTALEWLYSAPAENTAVSAIAVQLALHYQKARIKEKAIHYLHLAGERAVQLSAFQEANAHLNNGLALLMTLPESLERNQKELAFQISLGIASLEIIPDSAGEKVLARARELSQQMGMTTQLCRVLGMLSTFPYVRGEHQVAFELAKEALFLAQATEDGLLEVLCHWHLGFILFTIGDYTTAHTHLQQVIAFYNPQQHHRAFLFLRGSDAGVSALAYDACCLWCLGYPEQADKCSQQAQALARELDHAFSLADVLCFAGCVFNEMRRDTPALKNAAQELKHISQGMSFISFSGTGTCYWGEALAKLGEVEEGIAQMRQGMEIRQSVGARCYLTGILGALAEAQAQLGQLDAGLATLTEVFDRVEEMDERYYEAELFRLNGELLWKQGNEIGAEANLCKAVEVARCQHAKSWELRAATSLARLWHTQGKTDDAHRVLTNAYHGFTEGFNTPDLRNAKALLEKITSS